MFSAVSLPRNNEPTACCICVPLSQAPPGNGSDDTVGMTTMQSVPSARAMARSLY